jgi:hypothetical protein
MCFEFDHFLSRNEVDAADYEKINPPTHRSNRACH